MWYDGQHQTYDLNDGYDGSGIDLPEAYEQFGKENFTFEILFDYDNFKDMNDKEREVVDWRNPMTYNKIPGGQGIDIADNPEISHKLSVRKKAFHANPDNKELIEGMNVRKSITRKGYFANPENSQEIAETNAKRIAWWNDPENKDAIRENALKIRKGQKIYYSNPDNREAIVLRASVSSVSRAVNNYVNGLGTADEAILWDRLTNSVSKILEKYQPLQ